MSILRTRALCSLAALAPMLESLDASSLVSRRVAEHHLNAQAEHSAP
jgi:hypothetical protein